MFQKHDDDFGEWILIETIDDLTEVVKAGDVLTVRVRAREPEQGTPTGTSERSELELAKEPELEQFGTLAPVTAPEPVPAPPSTASVSKKEEKARKKAEEKLRKEEQKSAKKAARARK